MASAATPTVPWRIPRNNLAVLRKGEGYTQAGLAAALHVDKSTVSKWERREIDIPTRRVQQLLDILQIHYNHLFPGPVSFDFSEREILRAQKIRELSEDARRLIDRGLNLPDETDADEQE